MAETDVILAKLHVLSESIYYDMFDQRIDFVVSGMILNDQFPALTYDVQGVNFGFYGRCSTIAWVCGVDLYLNHSYTSKQGDVARQGFSISVARLYKQVKR